MERTTALASITITSCPHLPGLRSAESSRSGLLVAPITKTSEDFCRPSSSANSWDTTLQTSRHYHTNTLHTVNAHLSITPLASPVLPLLGAMESSSSKKTIQGAAPLAREKISRTFSSVCPTYILISSGPFTLKSKMWRTVNMVLRVCSVPVYYLRKWTPHSVATALARRVFPVPGGP